MAGVEAEAAFDFWGIIVELLAIGGTYRRKYRWHQGFGFVPPKTPTVNGGLLSVISRFGEGCVGASWSNSGEEPQWGRAITEAITTKTSVIPLCDCRKTMRWESSIVQTPTIRESKSQLQSRASQSVIQMSLL